MYGINCVDTTEALIENVGLEEVYSSGKTIQYYYSWDGKKFYDRFQVIGKK